MSTEPLKRIMWRLREKNFKPLHLKDIKDAIYEEVGLDDRTIDKYIRLLTEKGLIKRKSRYVFTDMGEVV